MTGRMRAFTTILLLIGSAALSAEHRLPDVPYAVPSLGPNAVVSIYGDYLPHRFGRSEQRRAIRRLELGAFSYTSTFPTADPNGILTAIVVDSRVEALLRRLLESEWYVNLGEYELWKQQIGRTTAYLYRHPLLDLEFTFSLERPGDAVLEEVVRAYPRQPDVRRQVLDRYRSNFVVRIHAAENVTNPGTTEITFDEALLMATLIGDRFQWLWGMHDGLGILFSVDPYTD